MEFSDREIAESDKESNNIAFFVYELWAKKVCLHLFPGLYYDLHFTRSLCKAECYLREKRKLFDLLISFHLQGKQIAKTSKHEKQQPFMKKTKNSPVHHLWQALCVRQIYTAKEGTIYFSYCTFVFYLIFRLRTRKEVKKECTERIRMSTVLILILRTRGKGV